MTTLRRFSATTADASFGAVPGVPGLLELTARLRAFISRFYRNTRGDVRRLMDAAVADGFSPSAAFVRLPDDFLRLGCAPPDLALRLSTWLGLADEVLAAPIHRAPGHAVQEAGRTPRTGTATCPTGVSGACPHELTATDSDDYGSKTLHRTRFFGKKRRRSNVGSAAKSTGGRVVDGAGTPLCPGERLTAPPPRCGDCAASWKPSAHRQSWWHGSARGTDGVRQRARTFNASARPPCVSWRRGGRSQAPRSPRDDTEDAGPRWLGCRPARAGVQGPSATGHPTATSRRHRAAATAD